MDAAIARRVAVLSELDACLRGFGTCPGIAAAWRHVRQMAVVELAAFRKAAEQLLYEFEAFPRFIESYNVAKAIEPAHLTAVLGSPYGFVWLKRAFTFFNAKHGDISWSEVSRHMASGQDATNYLTELLDRFDILVAGALIRQGSSHTFQSPVRIARPSTIPTSRFHIVPITSAAVLTGVASGRPVLCHASLRVLDHVEVNGCAIVIDPFDDFLFSEASEGACKEVGSDAASSFLSTLKNAIDILNEFCPEFHDELALGCSVVSPTLISSPSGFPSGTTSSSIGLACFSPPPSASVLCEMLVHEISHAHLFAFQHVDPLLDPAHHDEGWFPQDLYSPWRDDARPINGVVHGTFVFTRIANMWLRSLQHEKLDFELGRRRLAALRYQIMIGQKVLASTARWTPKGQSFFESLTDQTSLVNAACQKLGLDDVEPIYAEVASLGRTSGTAQSRQFDHLARWRRRNPALCPVAESALAAALAG